MIDYTHRSGKKELLDRDDIPFRDIVKNMQELDFINTWLGGHSITLRGIKKLTGPKKDITVCEIGCGGGDNLNAIYKFCNRKNITAKFGGIDINADCIAFAEKNSIIESVSFIVSDYKKVEFEDRKPDIIFSSLFCHHFSKDELIDMLRWMKKNAGIGFFINDLHRHPLAFNFIKIATKLFSRSYLVKHDARFQCFGDFVKVNGKNI